MVIGATMIDHCKSYISICRSQMNDQPKEVSFHPKKVRLLVPTLDFAPGRVPGFAGIFSGRHGKARSAAAVTVMLQVGCLAACGKETTSSPLAQGVQVLALLRRLSTRVWV